MDVIEDAIEAVEDLNSLDDEYEVKEASIQVRMSNLFGKIKYTLGWGAAPNKVISVQANDYMNSKRVIFQEGMLLVATLTEPFGEGELKMSHEVIVLAEINTTKAAYSLLRTFGDSEAIEAAKEYNKHLPSLIESCGKEFLNTSTLQKVLDVMREKPSFNAAHVVSYFGFVEALKNETVLNLLDKSEAHRGSYPIHIAVENETEKVVHHLLSVGTSIDVYDKQGSAPLHIAASKSVSLILALKPRRQVSLNAKNSKGETPLLIATKAEKLENIKCLLQSGANLNHEPEVPPNFDTVLYHEKLKIIENTRDISHKDLKKGGTLLHWVKTREMVNLSLDMGCGPDYLNDLGQSPLHIMVIRNRLNCLLTLLGRGANPNLVNNEGNSPLHIAASLSSVTMVQAFVCFGANINVVNRFGETPRHLASTAKTDDKKQGDKDKVIYLLHEVGASRCKTKSATCGDGCSVNGSFNGVPMYGKPLLRSRWLFDEHLAEKQILEAVRYQTLYRSGKKNRGRVLCLDGGGIKGLVLCQILGVIRNTLGQSITESFDWIAGTSTGGFLALDIATGKSVRHAQSLYYSLKDRIFEGTRPYDTSDLEKILKEEFGEDTRMSSIDKMKVNITTTLADRLPADLHLFRNYESPIDVLGIGESQDFVKPPQPHMQKIWLTARASGAAPTYFSSTDKYLDGGLVANNPVLDVLAEIEEWNMAVREANREDEVFVPTVVVSLGCGKPPVLKVDNLDLTVPSLLDMPRGFRAIVNMFNLLVEQACASEGRVVDRARAWCSSLHAPFFRFNPELSEDCAIDENDDAKLLRIMFEARSYMESQTQQLSILKDLLINNEEVDSKAVTPTLSTKSKAPLPPPRKTSGPCTPIKRTKLGYSASTSTADINSDEKLSNYLRETRSRSLVSRLSQTSLIDQDLDEDHSYCSDSDLGLTSQSAKIQEGLERTSCIGTPTDDFSVSSSEINIPPIVVDCPSEIEERSSLSSIDVQDSELLASETSNLKEDSLENYVLTNSL